MVKTTVLFTWDQLLAALIHLNFITLISICFKLMMVGVNSVIYGCSCARTLGVSLYNFKRQIKNGTVCTIRLFLPT